MNYQVLIPKPVQKQLDKIPRPDRDRIIATIHLLTEKMFISKNLVPKSA